MGLDEALAGNNLAVLIGALITAGLLVGVLSGLLGIGGGGILVPVLYETFGALHVGEEVRMHLAVGTSLAVVGATSLRSFMAHRARGTVDGSIVRRLAGYVLAGALLGVLVASIADSWTLRALWVVLGTIMAAKLAFGRDDWRLGDEIPKSLAVEAYAVAVGFVSVLLSIAGAVYMVALMTLYNRPMLQSVGTSAGFGPFIALPGLAGFIWAGWASGGTPPFSLGYVNLAGAAIILPASLLAAPLGVRLAHGMSKRTLELAFAAFLALVVLRFLVSLLA